MLATGGCVLLHNEWGISTVLENISAEVHATIINLNIRHSVYISCFLRLNHQNVVNIGLSVRTKNVQEDFLPRKKWSRFGLKRNSENTHERMQNEPWGEPGTMVRLLNMVCSVPTLNVVTLLIKVDQILRTKWF